MISVKCCFHHPRLKSGARHKMTMDEVAQPPPAADTKGAKAQVGIKSYFLCRLEISGVEASDVGAYKAVAKNSTGEGHATINLNFEEGADLGSRPKIPDGIPPRFPKKPTIRQEGDNLVMECLLEAHPLPEITWWKGDKARKFP